MPRSSRALADDLGLRLRSAGGSTGRRLGRPTTAVPDRRRRLAYRGRHRRASGATGEAPGRRRIADAKSRMEPDARRARLHRAAICARSSAHAALPRSPACSPASTAASWRRVRRAHRRAVVSMSCRPGATSTPSIRRAVPTPTAWDLGWKSAVPAARTLPPGSRRLAAVAGALGLGHGQHAHRRRRHRPGAGADRRPADLGSRLRPRLRLRDPAALDARPPARRRHPARLRLLPRRLPRADRPRSTALPAPSPRSTSRKS